jgi:Domain of unknown function (DUF4381)
MNPNPALQLRDIHLPPEPSWWPPAPGWWLLAVLTIVLLVVLVRLLQRRWRVRKRMAALNAEFDAVISIVESSARLAAISQLLRRAARLRHPGAANLQGEAWLRFLDSVSGDAYAAPFNAGVGRVLLDGPYRANIDPKVVEALVAPARRCFLALVATA